MHNGLLVIGSLLVVVSSITYIWAIVYGNVRPQRMTRLLLAGITGMTFISLLAGDDRSGMWLALVSFIESLAMWALSLWKGMGGTDRLDFICLGLCVAGVVWWIVSGDSLAGLIASIVADLVACIPSLVKTVRQPHTESVWFYLIGGVLAGVCFIAAGPYGWQALLFPVYILFINAAYVVAIWWPRQRIIAAGPEAA